MGNTHRSKHKWRGANERLESCGGSIRHSVNENTQSFDLVFDVQIPRCSRTDWQLEQGGPFDHPANRFDVRRDFTGGAEGNRTPDLLNAIQALSQLSYGPDR